MASASSSTIFVSRIRGLPVLDASGDQVGRLRDVLVQRRAGMLEPRVKGLVVELLQRERRTTKPKLRQLAARVGVLAA